MNVSCSIEKNVVHIQPYSTNELYKLNTFQELSIREYLRLLVSEDSIKKILDENKINDIPIFVKSKINNTKKIIIPVNGDKNFTQWIQKSDLNYLIPLLYSKQSCLNLVSTRSSSAKVYKTTVGKEVNFIIDLYLGKTYLLSSNESNEWYPYSRYKKKKTLLFDNSS